MVIPDNYLQLVEAVGFLVLLLRFGPVWGVVLQPVWGRQSRARQLRMSLVALGSSLRGLLPPACSQSGSSGRIGLQTCLGRGPGLGRAAGSRAPEARGFHIRFELHRIAASSGLGPSRADSRFCGHGRPVRLVREQHLSACVVSVPTCLLSACMRAGAVPLCGLAVLVWPFLPA